MKATVGKKEEAKKKEKPPPPPSPPANDDRCFRVIQSTTFAFNIDGKF